MLIARALVTKPEVLLLDEPTTGLKFVARGQLCGSVGRLAREGTTILIVTHHIEEVIPETRRVVLLARQPRRFDGGGAAALTPERLGAVYGAPLEVEKSSSCERVGVDRMSETRGRSAPGRRQSPRQVAASQGLRPGRAGGGRHRHLLARSAAGRRAGATSWCGHAADGVLQELPARRFQRPHPRARVQRLRP